jgi:two-component system, NarL family, response regulator LiaR
MIAFPSINGGAMIRILLVDDHPIVREGSRAVLETQPDFEVVAEAENGEEALRLATAVQPDILLLDLEMPVLDGVETIRQLSRRIPKLRILVFTAFDDEDRIISAVQAGAHGYLLKGAPREELFKAIRVTMEGGSLLQPIVASKLLQHMGQRGSFPQRNVGPQFVAPNHIPNRTQNRVSASTPLFEALTERELEVLRLLAQGMPNKEIAAHLVISERTAKFHVSSIMGKLGATNRTEAVSLAAQKGLITLN